MACQLADLGQAVANLIVIDSYDTPDLNESGTTSFESLTLPIWHRLDEYDERVLHRVFDINWHALRSYRPRTLTKGVLNEIRAEQSAQRLLRGALRNPLPCQARAVTTVLGSHSSIFDSNSVRQLAREIDAILTRPNLTSDSIILRSPDSIPT